MKPMKPEKHDLAYLSQLYNSRRELRNLRNDFEAKYIKPIQEECAERIKKARTEIDWRIKGQEDHVKNEIFKLKSKFRIPFKWTD